MVAASRSAGRIRSAVREGAIPRRFLASTARLAPTVSSGPAVAPVAKEVNGIFNS